MSGDFCCAFPGKEQKAEREEIKKSRKKLCISIFIVRQSNSKFEVKIKIHCKRRSKCICATSSVPFLYLSYDSLSQKKQDFVKVTTLGEELLKTYNYG